LRSRASFEGRACPRSAPDQVILAVDDELLVLEIIESTAHGRRLRRAQRRPAAPNGDGRTWKAGRARDHGALVNDVKLGRPPNGWAVARRARELNPGLLVLYVSGDSAHELTQQGVHGGVMLDKPFVPGKLLRAMACFEPEVAAHSED